MQCEKWLNDPIDFRRYAELASANFLCTDFSNQSGPVYFARTHGAFRSFRELAKKGPCILVTSTSDKSVTQAESKNLPSNVIRWFSNNVLVEDSRIECTPIGVVDSPGRVQIMKDVVSRGIERKYLLSVCFSTGGVRRERVLLRERFKSVSWATVRGNGSGVNDVPAEDFYFDMASHKYILSPEGVGLDCWRTWEAMYLGSIPIVKRSLVTTSLLSDLPCLIVDDWEEVTEKYLEDMYDGLIKRFNQQCVEKLTMSYWKERVLRWVKG